MRPVRASFLDYCDITQVMFTDKKMLAGKYSVEVSQLFKGDYLPNVLGVGVQVSTSKD